MKKLIILTVILLSTFQVFPQNEAWERISPKPLETSLTAITQVPETNRIIVIGRGASIMYTDDIGENWNVTYQPTNNSRFVAFNKIHFVDSNTGYIVGSKSTILKTSDGGINWQEIIFPGDRNLSDIFFHNELHGSIIGNGKVYTTYDGCQSWDSIVLSGSGLHYINDSVGYLSNINTSLYFRTEDAGSAWDTLTVVTSMDDFKITKIKYQNDLNASVSGRNDYGTQFVFKTNDGGQSWSEIEIPNITWVNDFYFFNADTGFAIGATWYHNVLLKSTDGGNSWSECTMPYTSWYLNSILFYNDTCGLCVGNYGQILQTENLGDNWVIYDEHKTILRKTNTTVIIGDSNIITGGYIFNGDAQGTIYRSVDRGETWVHSIGGNGTYGITSICFINEEIGYACGPYSYGDILKSTDGGGSWSTYEFGNWQFRPYVVYFINDSVGFIGGEDDDTGCYKTNDGGISWYPLTCSGFTPNYVVDFSFVNDSIGWALIEGAVLQTFDQGETWDIFDDFGYYYYSKMKFFSDSIGYIIGNYMYKTIDGGQSWYQIEAGLDGYYWMTDIDFPTPEIGYLTVDEKEETLLKSVDGGESWFPIDFPCTTTATSLAFFNENEGLVFGNIGIIFKTYTGGIVDIPEFPSNNNHTADLICYPNPVKDILNVKLDDTEKSFPDKLVIYNSFGKKVKSVNIQIIQNEVSVFVSDLDIGLYFIATQSRDKVIKSNKFVKM